MSTEVCDTGSRFDARGDWTATEPMPDTMSGQPVQAQRCISDPMVDGVLMGSTSIYIQRHLAMVRKPPSNRMRPMERLAM